MSEKRTIIDQIEITRSRHVQVRFALLLLEGEHEISSQWHRSAIEPGGDMDAMVSAVNGHLVSMGAAEIEPGDIPLMKKVCEVAHTRDVVKKFRADALERQKVGVSA